ncbi:unnamed protein product [Mucor circinelloides]
MRFNILSLGLVATVFMSASFCDNLLEHLRPGIDEGSSNYYGVVDALERAPGNADAARGAAGELRKRDVSDTTGNLGNSGIHDTAGNIADSVTNGDLSDTIADATRGVVGSSAPETATVNKRSFSLSRRRLLQRRTDAENEEYQKQPEQKPEQKEGKKEEKEGLTRRSPDGDDVKKEETLVRRLNGEDENEAGRDEEDENDKGKRKRSVVGEPDEEEADEEEPEEEEVDENEEETDEEEADELGDAAPAGRR